MSSKKRSMLIKVTVRKTKKYKVKASKKRPKIKKL